MRVRGGENVRATGFNGSYTLSAEAAAEVEEEAAPSVEAWTGAWYPSHAGAGLIDLTAGSVSDGITTFTPTVTGIVVHATSLNYVYLECDTTPGTLDGYVTGGVITASAIVAYTTTKTNTNSKLYILLCTWQASALVARYKYYSMTVDTRDTGANATLARYIALP
jgi:hypothetical protein